MKLTRFVIAIPLSVFAVLGLVPQRAANAQADITLVPIQPQAQQLAGVMHPQQHTIRIRNLKASTMAWMLDPDHNTIPIQLQVSAKHEADAFVTFPEATENWAKNFKLPAGVEQIIAVDPQNILLVAGTDEGVRELQQTIAAHDRPFRQVEIEAQFVRVNEQDAAVLGINAAGTSVAPLPMPDGKNQTLLTLHVAPGNVQGELNRLIAEHKAQILTAPRITSINHLTATIGTTSPMTPLPSSKSLGGLSAGTGFQFAANPSVNKDDTVTLAFSLTKTLQLSQEKSAGVFPLQALDVASGTIAAKDGEMLVLTASEGSLASLLGGLNHLPLQDHSTVVVLLKASIIRRAGEDEYVPGT